VFKAGGPSTRTIRVPVATARTPEPNKTFQVPLTEGTAEIGEKSPSTVTILDVD